MTKAQLINKLADGTEIPKKQVEQLVDLIVSTVIESVRNDDPVKIPGLGVFRMRKMKARTGRNPQTGEPIEIPARTKVGFTVAKTFKEAVLGTPKG